MILLVVGGSPSALQTSEMTRELASAGHRIGVAFESHADLFVGPGAFANVVEDTTEPLEALIFAPANTGTLARLAYGLGTRFAERAYAEGMRPAVVALEADEATTTHPAVLRNIEILRGDGCRVLEPYKGGMASVGEVVAAFFKVFGGTLSGVTVVVTAGGTREPIDAVRFIGNRSSGKMGLAVAREAVKRGADVVVVAANLSEVEPGVEWVSAQTVEEMKEATMKLAAEAEVLVMAAAVSDFRPSSPVLSEKVRRRAGLTVRFEPTPDILREIRQLYPQLYVVGFAATPGNPVPDAREKLQTKGADLLVGNDISRPGVGFGSDDNEVYIVSPGEERFVPQTSKDEVARIILDVATSEMLKASKQRITDE